jgi:hypothetical protein
VQLSITPCICSDFGIFKIILSFQAFGGQLLGVQLTI